MNLNTLLEQARLIEIRDKDGEILTVDIIKESGGRLNINASWCVNLIGPADYNSIPDYKKKYILMNNGQTVEQAIEQAIKLKYPE
jgi:hypothetical protein